MLKWLVTRPPAPPQEVLTEDPLATLGPHTTQGKVTQVYAVSRVNPLYEEEDGVGGGGGVGVGGVAGGGGGGGGDGASLRSSGYGSKETDSDGEEGGVAGGVVVSCQPAFVSAISVGVRRARSLEALPPLRPTLPLRQVCTVPRPAPPRRPPTHPAPLLSCDTRYVACVLTHRPPQAPHSPPLHHAPQPPVSTPQHSAGTPEVGPDSLLTPATLRLMVPRGADPSPGGSSEHLYEVPRTPPVPRPLPSPPSARRPRRGLSASLSRAPSRASLPRPRSRSAEVVGVAAGVGGVAGAVALWAASGLKTNGRKLVVVEGAQPPQDDDEDVFGPPQPPQGHDNPAFEGDAGPPPPLALEEFQRRLAQRLQGAPPHRAAWLDVRHGLGGRGGLGRRVTFTADTRSPRTPRPPRPPSPRPSMRLQPAPHSHYRPPWTTPGLHQLLNHADSSAGPWGYGSLETAAPHPNPGCVSEQCHDFTLDLHRSEKQRALARRRRRRRRWCVVVVVVLGLAGLVAVVVAMSLFATRGGRGGGGAWDVQAGLGSGSVV